MRKSNTKQTQPKSKAKPKLALDRERNLISKIERINEELTRAAESGKPYLLNQRRRLEAMVNGPVYSKKFDILCEIERLRKELAIASGSQKSFLENRLRRLEAKITPPKKQKALEDGRPIVAKCLEGFRAGVAPTNHTKFIKWLREQGVLTAYRNPKTEAGRSKGLRSVRQPAPVIAPHTQAVSYDMPGWMKGKEPAALLQLGKRVDNAVTAVAPDGALAGTRRGKAIPVSDTTVRAMLRSVFGLKSQKGRKPRSQNSK